MSQRVPFPADVYPEPGPPCRRTLDLGLTTPANAVALKKYERPPLWRWLLAALVVLVAGVLLSGCDAQAADTPTATTAEIKRAAAGAWLCPGMHAEWLDAKTVQCLRERP